MFVLTNPHPLSGPYLSALLLRVLSDTVHAYFGLCTAWQAYSL
jgi:hypothetical protein